MLIYNEISFEDQAILPLPPILETEPSQGTQTQTDLLPVTTPPTTPQSDEPSI